MVPIDLSHRTTAAARAVRGALATAGGGARAAAATSGARDPRSSRVALDVRIEPSAELGSHRRYLCAEAADLVAEL